MISQEGLKSSVSIEQTLAWQPLDAIQPIEVTRTTIRSGTSQLHL